MLTQSIAHGENVSEDAAIISSPRPKKRNTTLSLALNQIRMQTAGNNDHHQRNEMFARTTASTPKSRQVEFRGSTVNTKPQLGDNVINYSSFKQIEIKPRLLETKITEDVNFMKLSDGFRRLFQENEKTVSWCFRLVVMVDIDGVIGARTSSGNHSAMFLFRVSDFSDSCSKAHLLLTCE